MIYLIMPGKVSTQLNNMANAAIKNKEYKLITSTEELPDLRNKKILFAMELDSVGINIPLMNIMCELANIGNDSLLGATGALLVHSNTELYTKSKAANLIFLANQLGCSFIGHPLIEATGNLQNFKTWQKTVDSTLEEISLDLSSKLGNRLIEHKPPKYENPKLGYLHSSSRETSNTLSFWNMISSSLHDINIEELYIENGSVFDCYGCAYKTCLKFGEKKSCFYGGIMTEKILPAVESSDILVWICPNYNDSISSNLMAVINRLTTLYRRMNFHDKTIFAVIVSGNSGSDSIAKQLIDALSINKGFYLPPYFCIMETANDAGSLVKIPNIDKKSRAFAEHIKDTVFY